MLIALGTTSEDKKTILLSVLQTLNLDIKIQPVEVESGISDQPMDELTTIIGARNRAKAALISVDADMGIGLEGGLSEINDELYLVCVAVIKVKEKEYLGISSKLVLPTEVSNEIKQGVQFGEAIRGYKLKNSGKGDIFDHWINELISRRKLFGEAILNAFWSFL